MDYSLSLSVSLILAYFLGSILGAIWVSRLFGLPDPSSLGSGNPGATNLYRIGGKIPALLTLTWDAGKGALALIAARGLGVDESGTPWVALAAVLGHILPAFHRLKGGKGMATATGAALLVAPATTAVLIGLWVLLVRWRRISSLASLSCAALSPWLAWWLDPSSIPLFLALALLIIVRHRDNIVRLVRNQEKPLE